MAGTKTPAAANGEALAGPLDHAQQTVREIDAIARSADSAVEFPSDDLDQPSASQTLSEVDESLAEDVDNLLQGDFESIDAVLDGVFEEQATIVQRLGEKLPPPAPAPAPPTEAPVALEAPPSPPVEVAPVEPVAAAEPQAIPEPVPAPVAIEPEPAPVKVQRPVRDPAPVPAAQPKTPRKPSALAARLLPPIVRVLSTMNYPLRSLPSGFRTIIDWAALSLLVWVPIVWIMVFTLSPKHPANSPASSVLMHSPSPANSTVHKESTNAAETHTENETSKKAEPAKAAHHK